MKQLVILSGKGGTGKTSVAAAFAHLAAAGSPPLRAVLADADVDAANLELVLQARLLEEHDFVGGSVAVIAPDLCTGCGICAQVCRFDAIIPPSPDIGRGRREGEGHPSPDIGRAKGEPPQVARAGGESQCYCVNAIACDGCAACVYQCPDQAIRMEAQVAGRWFRSQTPYGPLFHAALRPAQENSGKLVTLVKQQARLFALDNGHEAVLVDGPPGIGCPVISAASGADLALIVTEPTAAGIHDMERVLATTAHFRIPSLVCINKADIYPAVARDIEAFCCEKGIEIVGSVPFDTSVAKAIVHGKPVTVHAPDAPASLTIREMWQQVSMRLQEATQP